MEQKKGFTLIELLVVISIIALLMSILMPSLSKVKEQARRVICMSNQSQWGKFVTIYATENDDSFPMGFDSTGSGAPRTGSWNFTYDQYLEKPGTERDNGTDEDYNELRFCPSAPFKPTTSYTMGGYSGNKGWWSLWNALSGEDSRVDYGSYGFNRWTYDCPNVWPWANANRDGYQSGGSVAWNWKKVSRMSQPHEVPVLYDSWYSNAMPDDRDRPPQESGQVFQNPMNPASPALTGMGRVCIDRHNNMKNNVLMGDMSVSPIPLKELWTIKWHRNFDTRTTYNKYEQGGRWPDWLSR